MVKQREDDNRPSISGAYSAISICDKFGAERSHRKNGTVLTFEPEKLVRIGNLYNLETKIQTKIVVGDGGDSGEGSKQYTLSLCQSRNEGEAGDSGDSGDSGEGSKGDTPVLSQYKNDGEGSDDYEGSKRVPPSFDNRGNNEERRSTVATYTRKFISNKYKYY